MCRKCNLEKTSFINLQRTPNTYDAFFLSKFNLSFVFVADIRFSSSTFILFKSGIRFSSSTFVLFKSDIRFSSSTFVLLKSDNRFSSATFVLFMLDVRSFRSKIV